MEKGPIDSTDALARGGPYDGAAAEPWFLPDDGGDRDGGDILPPLPRADRRPLVDPAAWAAAQAALAADLAELAWLYGTLEERLRAGPAGWWHRLALREASELSWAVGDRIPVERLALWLALRLSGVQEDALGLARAAWAQRRLLGPEGIGSEGEGGLAGFFGRHGGEENLADLRALRAELVRLHPVVRAVALAQAWLMLGAGGPAGQIEALVLAGRMAAGMGRGDGFVPQAGAWTQHGGSVQDRLSLWLHGAARATRAALSHLDRLAAWQRRAARAMDDQKGRTAGLLVAVLTEWPMVTGPMAEALTGTSTASVLRNLTLMERRGVLREVTGQGRYRVWTAAL